MSSIAQYHQKYQTRISEILQDDMLYNRFKSDPIYTQMLEHVNWRQGSKYLELIQQSLPVSLEVWQQILQNDKIGYPRKFKYDTPFGPKAISPTTLRYFYYALEFIKLCQTNHDNYVNIVEIGGGYGGFCKILLDLAEYFNITVHTYISVEVLQASKLMKRYLSQINHGTCDNICFQTAQTLDMPNQIDYVLSYYSISELPTDIRKLYRNCIISNSKHGYIAWNFLPYEHIEDLMLGHTFTVEPENPPTGDHNNVIVKW